MTGENKDKLNHWLQIRPLESTARALSTAIYYIHECDLSGVRGGWRGKWWAPTCSTQLLRQLPARRSNRPPRSPLFSSSSPLQVPYRRWLTHFSCLPEPLPGENVVMWCVSALGGWVGLQHWTKASHLLLLYRNEGVTGAPKENMPFLIRCYCMWDCFCNGVSLPCMCFAAAHVNWAHSARHEANLPDKWIICQTLRDQMKVVILHKFHCAGVNCLQSWGLYGR